MEILLLALCIGVIPGFIAQSKVTVAAEKGAILAAKKGPALGYAMASLPAQEAG